MVACSTSRQAGGSSGGDDGRSSGRSWVQELVVVGVVAVVVGMPAVVEVVAGGSGSPRVVGDRSRSGNGENGREWWW